MDVKNGHNRKTMNKCKKMSTAEQINNLQEKFNFQNIITP